MILTTLSNRDGDDEPVICNLLYRKLVIILQKGGAKGRSANTGSVNKSQKHS